jgi:putative pyruvate formate lyase activating enzyme
VKADEPGYLALYRSEELARRVARLEARLADCDICPRQCGAKRLEGETGTCNSGLMPIVASAGAHHGEEPAISGSRGSGTIFFGNCNLRCVYCQNYQISQMPEVQRHNTISTGELAGHMLYLQDELGCHNINLVTPSHFVPQIARAVLEAVPLGLRIPLVYNTSSYDAVATLQELDGVVDIYLADLRYAADKMARRYSRVHHYVASSRAAIKEMQRQVGDLQLDDNGVARRGLIIRHLILPHDIAGSRDSLTWLVSEVSPHVAVSVMSQYYPAHKARKYRELNRKITPEEYAAVAEIVAELGIENGWMQGMASADSYRPDFDAEEPFQEGKRSKRKLRK